MAYTTPRTWTTGELVTAAFMNTHVRDNFSAGFPTDAVWTDWTPTLTGITQGNGTVVAQYIQVGSMVHARFEFTFGASGSAMSSGIVSLPVTASSSFTANNNTVGTAVYADASPATTNFGWVRLTSTTAIQPMVGNAAGTYIAISGISSTIPFTWASGDVLAWNATYEAA